MRRNPVLITQKKTTGTLQSVNVLCWILFEWCMILVNFMQYYQSFSQFPQQFYRSLYRTYMHIGHRDIKTMRNNWHQKSSAIHRNMMRSSSEQKKPRKTTSCKTADCPKPNTSSIKPVAWEVGLRVVNYKIWAKIWLLKLKKVHK